MRPLEWEDHRRIPRGAAAVMAALRLEGASTRMFNALSDREWRETLSFCDRAQLTLLLEYVARECLPGFVRERIDRNRQSYHERDRRMRASLCEIVDRLGGIEFVLLKGYSHDARYGPALRLQYDIDLFAPPSALAAARDALLSLQYEPLVETRDFPIDHLPAMIRKTGWQWRGDYFDPEIPPSVDLHFRWWDAGTERFAAPGVEEFWERRTRTCFEERSLPVLDEADRLGYAALHLLRHLLRGSLRVYHVYEVAHFLHSSAADLAYWRRRAVLHAPELRRLEATAFLLAHRWFACRIPAGVQTELEQLPEETRFWMERYGAAPLEALFRPNKAELWLHVSMLHGLPEKAAVVRRRLVPVRPPGPVDAVYVPAAEMNLPRRARRAAKYGAYAAGRALHHVRALLPTLAQGALWTLRRRRPASRHRGTRVPEEAAPSGPEPGGRPHRAAWLGLILLGALLLRLPALWWGLPPSIPHVVASDLRCSYAFDEDDILTSAARANPRALDFDPRMYHWGSLHLHLMQVWMEVVEASGLAGRSWRDAYYNMVPGAFERVYASGRALSIFMALVGIAIVFLLGGEFGGTAVGRWAAALVAVSPVHVMASVQIRVDLTMLALTALTIWLALRWLRERSPRLLVWMGLTAGLAVAAKSIALLTVAPVVASVLWQAAARPAAWVRVAVLGVCGLALGEPYVLVKGQEMFRQTYEILSATLSPPPGFRDPIHALLATQTVNAARFLLGLPAFVLAGVGLALMIRRRAAADSVVLCALLGSVAALVPLSWPLLRYQLPLLPVLGVAAGVALGRLGGRHRAVLGAAALAFPLFASLAQISYMRSPHPANEALRLILKETPPGSPISRMMAEMPPLDARTYPLGPNPFLDDIGGSPPGWVLTTDLPDREYPLRTRQTLEARYELRGDFRIRRLFAWASLGESGAPHDWKYTHPRMALYRLRDP